MAAPSLHLIESPVRQPARDGAAARLLSAVERVAAAGAACALSPLILGVMGAVRVLSGRSPLIAHRRVGRHGEVFWMWKVRTMWDGRERGSRGWIEPVYDNGLPAAKQAPDPRVTSAFAAFCRRHSIDELPQLLHVASGRMSLVGPRPMTRIEIDTYYGRKAADEVLSVRPGLTGLWQILGRNRRTYAQRRRLDLFLVRKARLALYLRILAATPLRVLSGRDSW